MSTLAAVRQETLQSGPDFGGVYLATALAAQTVTVAQLADGGKTAAFGVDRYLLRPDTASAADRVRTCTNFVSSTGVFTHTGTAYADTTVGTEALEVHIFDPRDLDTGINVALGKIRRLATSILPAVAGRNWLYNYDWIQQPSDVRLIEYVSSPQLTNNRYLQEWNSYSSAGVLQPDRWTLSGTAATCTRGSTFQWRGQYTASLTPGGAAAGLLTQSVGLLENGVSADTLRGEVVTVVGVARATDASNVRVWVDDGSGKQYSSYHTGGSTFEELTKQITISSTATMLDCGIEAASGKAVCQVGELYLMYGTISDSVRADNYTGDPVWSEYEQGSSGLPVNLPIKSFGSHYRIKSYRPYPQFPWSMIRAGTADALVTDCPLQLAYIGGIAELYRKVYGKQDKRTIDAQNDFATMCLDHVYEPGTSGDSSSGLPLPTRVFAAPTRGRGF